MDEMFLYECECNAGCGLKLETEMWEEARNRLDELGFPRSEYFIIHPDCPSIKKLKWVLVPDFQEED